MPLGKDGRYCSPPKVKPEEPPSAIRKKDLAAIRAQAGPEGRKLSFGVEDGSEENSDGGANISGGSRVCLV